ncbi:pentapeptide repeat-containing protein [Hymenobacter cellulosivorans]|uniref:Pentapeptide repeat-containing protein n=1 Tax=Hymenobacter cellulosivorans TaxID=2932249 RepID=A0ABY4FHS3_9BACT|nr:pentapeptide repeat-containing protein [Hymenobacter cellulosivorans]UOQ54011.1 pentapeptide repeat-containing protein [Hymenobacter cellulosivorans]
MKQRRAKPAGRPTVFPAENRFERWDARALAAHPEPEFEQCHFIGCDFSGAQLGQFRFADCLFERCNLSSAAMAGASLQNVAFTDCKLSGVQFAACRDFLFEVQFQGCQLHYASFFGKKLRNTRFVNCSLTDADFTSADLTDAAFQDCTLRGAVFRSTQLVGADFTTASEFSIDPDGNTLTKARFTLTGLLGLVDKYGVIVE